MEKETNLSITPRINVVLVLYQGTYLSNSDCSWHCTKCDFINYSLGPVSDLNSFAYVNSFNALHSPDKGFQHAL